MQEEMGEGRKEGTLHPALYIQGDFFTLQGAPTDPTRPFQSVVGPISTKDPHRKMCAYKPTKCTLARKKTLKAYWIW